MSDSNRPPVAWSATFWEVLRVALPLMVSTATYSFVLFTDRTMLLKYDGTAMSASMAGGNLYWTIVCFPLGLVSMTGAIISQMVGANEVRFIGRFLWQSVWFSLATAPLFAFMAWIASDLFRWADQPAELIPLESIYFRLLMLGSVGSILESALGGFFSGTERSSTVMYVSITAGLMNIVLDWWLIFGVGPFPELGIAGAAIASSLSFWFKALCFAGLLLRKPLNEQYQFLSGMSFDPKRLWTLLYFGSPTGLVFLNEAAGFSLIVLRIGRLGDIPLRATTMAINFNMIAFIPLVGVSIATSVLVGRRLVESGPASAKQCVIAALAIGWIYSAIWGGGYLWVPDWMLSLYAFESATEDSFEAISLATGLLWFVALYVLLDATQLILAGALRGAGDTWFVLLNGFIMTAFTLTVGLVGEPATEGLTWWWWMVTLWVWLLAMGMTARYLQGRWQFMRMV